MPSRRPDRGVRMHEHELPDQPQVSAPARGAGRDLRRRDRLGDHAHEHSGPLGLGQLHTRYEDHRPGQQLDAISHKCVAFCVARNRDPLLSQVKLCLFGSCPRQFTPAMPCWSLQAVSMAASCRLHARRAISCRGSPFEGSGRRGRPTAPTARGDRPHLSGLGPHTYVYPPHTAFGDGRQLSSFVRSPLPSARWSCTPRSRRVIRHDSRIVGTLGG